MIKFQVYFYEMTDGSSPVEKGIYELRCKVGNNITSKEDE